MKIFSALDIGYFVISLLSVVPFLFLKQPPITDMPAHISRLFILCQPEKFAGIYQVKWTFIPNISMDLLWLPLCGVMDPSLFVRGLIAVTLLAIFALGWLIRRSLYGRVDFTLLLMPAMAINLVTSMGYVNFLTSIVVIMLMVYALVRNPQISWKNIALLTTILGAAAYGAHIFGLMFLMAITGCWIWMNRFSEQGMAGGVRAVLVSILLFIVPFAMVIAGYVGTEESTAIHYRHIYRTVIAPVMAGDLPIEFVIGLLLYIVIIVGLFQKIIAIPSGWKLSLAAGVFLSVVPPSWAFGAYDIGSRLVIPTLFMMIAIIKVDVLRKGSIPLKAMACIILAYHAWAVATIWVPFDKQVSHLLQDAKLLPSGIPLLTVSEKRGPHMHTSTRFFYAHLASYVEIDRQLFDPLGFNGDGMQPLMVEPNYQPFDIALGLPINSMKMGPLMYVTGEPVNHLDLDQKYLANWNNRFPYILYFHYGRPMDSIFYGYEIVAKGDFYWILRSRNKDLTTKLYR